MLTKNKSFEIAGFIHGLKKNIQNIISNSHKVRKLEIYLEGNI